MIELGACRERGGAGDPPTGRKEATVTKTLNRTPNLPDL